MHMFKSILFTLAGLILVLLGLSIVLKQMFGIVMPALSTLLEIFAGVALMWVGFMVLQKLFTGKHH